MSFVYCFFLKGVEFHLDRQISTGYPSCPDFLYTFILGANDMLQAIKNSLVFDPPNGSFYWVDKTRELKITFCLTKGDKHE